MGPTSTNPDTIETCVCSRSIVGHSQNKDISVWRKSHDLRVCWIFASGCQRVKTLPVLHAFSGADNVGKFNPIGKATWLNVFLKAGNDVADGLLELLK